MPGYRFESTALESLTYANLLQFVSARPAESVELEFKQQIPRGRGSEDSLVELAKSVCAFANSYGGTVIVGVTEENSAAAALNPLENCEGLADSIARSVRGSIDPPLDSVIVKAFATPDAEDGRGVVVIRVSVSPRRPHAVRRGQGRLVAYVRRDRESLPLDMRQIQELTLRQYSKDGEIRSRVAELERSYVARLGAGAYWEPHGHYINRHYTVYACAVPMQDVAIPNIGSASHVEPDPRHVGVQIDSAPHTSFRTDWLVSGFKPGFRRRESAGKSESCDSYAAIHGDGSCEFGISLFGQEKMPPHDYVGVLSMIGLWIRKIRVSLGRPSLEYAVFHSLSIEQIVHAMSYSGATASSPITTGPYPSDLIAIGNDESIVSALRKAWIDFHNLSHREVDPDRVSFQLPE